MPNTSHMLILFSFSVSYVLWVLASQRHDGSKGFFWLFCVEWTISLVFPHLSWLTSSAPLFGGFALCIYPLCLILQVNCVNFQERSRPLGTALGALCVGDLHEGLLKSIVQYSIDISYVNEIPGCVSGCSPWIIGRKRLKTTQWKPWLCFLLLLTAICKHHRGLRISNVLRKMLTGLSFLFAIIFTSTGHSSGSNRISPGDIVCF